MGSLLMGLHTSLGQPPNWNGRLIWSLSVDAMEIAMVCWEVTGLFICLRLKRMRVPGGIVISVTLLTATAISRSMVDFYATTKL